MIIDARTLPQDTTIEAEICVVGAGAAGITLAHELADGKQRVALLESGGFEFDVETQNLYDGETAGQSYTPIVADRLRYFGGTTNHWSGSCRPFDPIDFEARPHIPNSGWPFGRNTLEEYYRRAQRICELGPFTYEPADWVVGDARPLELATGAQLATGIYQGSPPTRFGEVYRQELSAADQVTVYLNANVIDIDTDATARNVTGLSVACLHGPRLRAKAKCYVLAAGGIENARLLLNANKVQKQGLGNEYDVVGRYFMDHPYVTNAATIVFDQQRPALAFYDDRKVHGVGVQGFLCAPPEVLAKERLSGFSIGIQPGNLPDKDFAKLSLLTVYRAVRSGHIPDHLAFHVGRIFSGLEWEAAAVYDKVMHRVPVVYSTNYVCECPPDPENRVTLTDATDQLGLRRVRLNWCLPSDFGRNIRRAHALLAYELGRAGFGRVRMNSDDSDGLMKSVGNAHHHMGTTRMHRDPRSGVVDENCRVHSMSNLFIAGSSVFPTYSFDDPTMTIVALATRLSDHLKTSSE